jgi:hypothetical protein
LCIHTHCSGNHRLVGIGAGDKKRFFRSGKKGGRPSKTTPISTRFRLDRYLLSAATEPVNPETARPTASSPENCLKTSSESCRTPISPESHYFRNTGSIHRNYRFIILNPLRRQTRIALSQEGSLGTLYSMYSKEVFIHRPGGVSCFRRAARSSLTV